MGSYAKASDFKGDGELIPLVRIAPQYPRNAARDGIEGWVKMEFTINKAGTVSDPKVLESKPRRVFDRAARRAILKWKFKPRVVDGKPVAGLNRIPAEGESRSNMHVGGRPELSELTTREHEICEAIGPELKKRDLIFVGIDVIGGYLTEINVTSPTGIREVKRFGGPDIATLVWDAIELRR